MTASPHPDGFRGPSNSPQPEAAAAAFNISNEETVRRLRAKGQPIRLFGESDKERRLRLRALELIEEKGHDKAGGNDFRKALEDVEKSERELKATEGGGDSGKGKKKGSGVDSGESVLDLELLKTDPDRLYPIIYYALKRALKEWEESLAGRPGRLFYWVNSCVLDWNNNADNIKRSTQGKLAAATQVQSAEYLKPLFKLIRSRVRDCRSLRLIGLSANKSQLYSHYHQTCSPASLRLFTTCKNANTNERMTLTSDSQSVTPHGQLVSPWLGTSSGFLCCYYSFSPAGISNMNFIVSTNVLPARRSRRIKLPMC